MAREGRAVANQRWLSRVLWLVLVVFGITALAYFVAPTASLQVVGIASDPTERFLLRTLAAALLAFVVPLWLAATRPSTSLRHGLVWGVVTYLVASTLVDLAAYIGDIVSGLSVPSAVGLTTPEVGAASTSERSLRANFLELRLSAIRA